MHFIASPTDLLFWRLAPVIYEINKTEKAEFHFINGPNEAAAAPGMAEQYEGPYYRFLDSGAPQITDIQNTSEPFPGQDRSSEDFEQFSQKVGLQKWGLSRACDFVQDYVEQQDGVVFDGILGFSEGATIAANLILRQCRKKGSSLFDFAVFICCTVPPLWPDKEDNLLADKTAERIKLPTAHIVGFKDPGYYGGRALYNLCMEASASIFDHGGFHLIPWDLASTRGIAREIRLAANRSRSVSFAS